MLLIGYLMRVNLYEDIYLQALHLHCVEMNVFNKSFKASFSNENLYSPLMVDKNIKANIQ